MPERAPTRDTIYRGTIDCSGNPNYPAANSYDRLVVSIGGKIGGASGTAVNAGDTLVCNVDGTPAGNQATVGTSWTVTPGISSIVGTPPASVVGGGGTNLHLGEFV